MKYFKRKKKEPEPASQQASPAAPSARELQGPWAQTQRPPQASPAAQQQQPPLGLTPLPPAAAEAYENFTAATSTKKAQVLEREVASLREQNERLSREKQDSETHADNLRATNRRQVQELEREVDDLRSQLSRNSARPYREDYSEESSGGLKLPDSTTVHLPIQDPGDLDRPLKAAYVPLAPRGVRNTGGGVPRKYVIGACIFAALETALLLGFALAYFGDAPHRQDSATTPEPRAVRDVQEADEEMNEQMSKVNALQRDLRTSMDQEKYWEKRFNDEHEYLQSQIDAAWQQANQSRKSKKPYEQITGQEAHQVPEFYDKVREKTIWAYWYHKDDCPDSKKCTLPPVVQLCSETIERNKGTFDFRIVHMDEVDKYVNKVELPFRWSELIPAHQKDSLMNALLARYGGVAMDISTLLLRPIDDYWEEMTSQGATFMGFMYRLNGLPWRHAETTAVWFLMSRREGIFSTAVRNQVMGMGDRSETGAYHHWYLALGDQTITPILHMFNYSLPKCTEDRTIVSPPPAPQWDQKLSMCPEHEVRWDKNICGPERNDTRVILRDPRDGPQLPFAFSAGMALWQIEDTEEFSDAIMPETMHAEGAPMQGEACNSPSECWQVFMTRYQTEAVPGKARLLDFVKLFAHAKELQGMSRQEILGKSSSFFVNWLRLAGVVI